MTLRDTIIYTANACLGTQEGSGRHQTIIDIYNQYPGKIRGYKITLLDPWCAAFVSAVFIASGLADLIPIECSCFYMKNEGSKRGRIRDPKRYIPKKGDLIFYRWAGKNVVSHVGIIEDVHGSALTVIEGNYQDSVGKRRIKLSYQYIDSYYEVDYGGSD